MIHFVIFDEILSHGYLRFFIFHVSRLTITQLFCTRHFNGETTTHRHGFLLLSVSCPGQEKNGRSARGNFGQVGVHERVNRPSWLEISGTARDSRAERKKADRSGKRKRTGSGYRGARGPTKFRAFAAFHAETFSDLSLL